MTVRVVHRARRDQRGSILLVATVGVVLAVIAAGLAVDTGRIAAEKRTNQKVADLAALDAVREAALGQTIQRARESAERNGFAWNDSNYDLVVERGWIDAARNFTVDPAGDAVRVTARTIDFQQSFIPGSRPVTAQAVAALDEKAQVSVGSSLATLSASDSPVLNAVFSRLLGISPSLTMSLVSYRGLADGSVTIGELVAADPSLGTPEGLLSSTVSLRQLAQATVTALTARGDAASVTAATILGTFAGSIGSGLAFSLGDVVDVNSPSDPAVAAANLNVLDLLTTGGQAAQIANGTNFLSIPGLTLGIPNLASSTLGLTLIEAPQMSGLGPARFNPSTGQWVTRARTAQVRVDLNTTIQVGGPCPGLLCVARLQLPISIDAARANASVTDIRCATPVSASEVDVLVETDALTAGAAATLQVAVTPAVSLPLSLGVASGSDTLTFAGPYPTPIQSTSSTGTIATSLLTSSGNPLLASVLGVLTPVTGSIDDLILQPVLELLGLSVAGADVRVMQVDCAVPTLVA